MLFANRILRSGATLGGNRPGDKKFRRERVGKVIVAPSDACGEARRPWTADGARQSAEESPPSERKAAPHTRGSREGRQGRRNDTARVARMIRPAMTLARDLVRRRLPAGASPSRREDRARSDAQSNAVRTEGGLRRPPGFLCRSPRR